MANGTGDTRAFDEERAHRDFDASLQAGRAASQAAILINGGAATALLAYLAGKAGVPIAQGGVPVGVIRAACIAFLCYAGGWFKVLFDQTMVGSNLEHARGHLSLQAAAFFGSLVVFLGDSMGIVISV